MHREHGTLRSAFLTAGLVAAVIALVVLATFWAPHARASDLHHPPFLSNPIKELAHCESTLGTLSFRTDIDVKSGIDAAGQIAGYPWQRDQSVVDLWNFWAYLVRRVQFRKPLDRPVQVMNLTAKMANESYALSAFFADGQFLAPDPQTKVANLQISSDYTGLSMIRRNRISAGAFPWAEQFAGSSEFFYGDAAEDAAYLQLPFQSADVVIIRNPRMRRDPRERDGVSAEWLPIFRQALNRILTGGFFLMTFESDFERDYAWQTLAPLNVTVLDSGRNPFATRHDDIFYLVVKK